MGELKSYHEADEEGKREKEEEWQSEVESAFKNLFNSDGASATTTFAAAVAAVVALLAF